MKTRPLMLAALLAPIATCWLGCSVKPRATFDGPAYPESPERLETLDIQVLQTETSVRMTNATARAFGPSRVWLNGWFAADIDGLAVGETVDLPLSAFEDEHGLPPDSGGFFATERREPIVMAELETERGLHGLKLIPLER